MSDALSHFDTLPTWTREKDKTSNEVEKAPCKEDDLCTCHRGLMITDSSFSLDDVQKKRYRRQKRYRP